MKNVTLYLLCVVFSISSALNAQETTTDTPKTIDEQFADLIKTSNSFEEYKVIKKYRINALKINTKKRVDELQGEITTLNNQIASQQSEAAKLNASLKETQTTLDTTNKEKDSMIFFGAQMSKGAYNTMMWSIAAVLLAGLLLFIFRFKNSNAITRQARRKLEETELDFDEYKRKALEKEQKLGRQLQDERNKALQASKA